VAINIYKRNCKKFTVPGNGGSQLENIQVLLDWICGIQEQINFMNNLDNLPDFELFFKVRLRRPPI
jgi:hypothetical protein